MGRILRFVAFWATLGLLLAPGAAVGSDYPLEDVVVATPPGTDRCMEIDGVTGRGKMAAGACNTGGGGSGTDVQVNTGGVLAAADFQDTARIQLTESSGVVSVDIVAGSVSVGFLDFDPATQAELDAHEGDANAHHPPVTSLGAAAIVYTPAEALEWSEPTPAEANAALNQLALDGRFAQCELTAGSVVPGDIVTGGALPFLQTISLDGFYGCRKYEAVNPFNAYGVVLESGSVGERIRVQRSGPIDATFLTVGINADCNADGEYGYMAVDGSGIRCDSAVSGDASVGMFFFDGPRTLILLSVSSALGPIWAAESIHHLASLATNYVPAANLESSLLGHLLGMNTRLGELAPLAGPVFTGDPQVPTAATGDSDTTAASTANVDAKIAAHAALPNEHHTPPDLAGHEANPIAHHQQRFTTTLGCPNPSQTSTTCPDSVMCIRLPAAMTLNRVSCWTFAGTQESNGRVKSAPADAGSAVLSTDLTGATVPDVATSGFNDQTVAAGQYLCADFTAPLNTNPAFCAFEGLYD